MEFYISPQSGQFYMINVLENQWLSVTFRSSPSPMTPEDAEIQFDPGSFMQNMQKMFGKDDV